MTEENKIDYVKKAKELGIELPPAEDVESALRAAGLVNDRFSVQTNTMFTCKKCHDNFKSRRSFEKHVEHGNSFKPGDLVSTSFPCFWQNIARVTENNECMITIKYHNRTETVYSGLLRRVSREQLKKLVENTKKNIIESQNFITEFEEKTETPTVQ
jgi:uncharacterized C2H2 Zn-finger protein